VITATGTCGWPVAVGQAHVCQAQLEALLAQQPARRGQVACGRRRQVHALERELDQLDQVWLVVDDEYSGFMGHGASLSPG
jgi:hypothetical protein